MNRAEGQDCRLIGRFVLVTIISSLLVQAQLGAAIVGVVNLQPEQLVGPWEAMVQREGAGGPNIYQMVFVSPKQAWLAQAASDSEFDSVQFVGRLISQDLTNGSIKLEFVVIEGQSESDYTDVRIEGRASAAGDVITIEGNITKKRKDGKATTDHVFFAKTLWTRLLPKASLAAEKAIREAQREAK